MLSGFVINWLNKLQAFSEFEVYINDRNKYWDMYSYFKIYRDKMQKKVNTVITQDGRHFQHFLYL
jgi:hypothetical protein